MVVRTGFGFFYSQESKNSIFDLNRGLGGRTGRVPDTTYSPSELRIHEFHQCAVCRCRFPVGLTWGADYHLPTTYSMTYLLNVQRTLGKHSTLEAGYNGSQSRKLANLINAAQPLPGHTDRSPACPIRNRRGGSSS